jgi:hypothetical protein
MPWNAMQVHNNKQSMAINATASPEQQKTTEQQKTNSKHRNYRRFFSSFLV